MKKIKTLIILLVLICSCLIFTFTLVGCNEKLTIEASVTNSLYEYDVDNQKTGNKVDDLVIEIGKRYKLEFDIKFENLEEKLEKKELTVTMSVKLGSYENEDNINLLNSGYGSSGGLNFQSVSDSGSWEANFILTSSSQPEFNNSYFIVGVDSIGLDSEDVMQPVSIKFFVKDKDGYVFNLNSANEYFLTLNTKKGQYQFSESDIKPAILGNNYVVKVPAACQKIKVALYLMADNKMTFVYEVVLDKKKDNTFSFNLFDLADDAQKTKIRNWLKGLGPFELGLDGSITITLVGGMNYFDKSISKDIIFKRV